MGKTTQPHLLACVNYMVNRLSNIEVGKRWLEEARLRIVMRIAKDLGVNDREARQVKPTEAAEHPPKFQEG